ncbi:unnamed protein product [Arabidopsis halleri]
MSFSDGDTGVKLTEFYDKLHELNSDAAEAQASKILAGSGFTENLLARPTSELSGGWRKRISLASALFEKKPEAEDRQRDIANKRLCVRNWASLAYQFITIGKKARVVLASILMSKPHILLLDEPTNHLDIQTIDAFADALYRFKGGFVLVTHDSRLISRNSEKEGKSEIWIYTRRAVTFLSRNIRRVQRKTQKRDQSRG